MNYTFLRSLKWTTQFFIWVISQITINVHVPRHAAVKFVYRISNRLNNTSEYFYQS